jgi:putative ABC transport system ATP-binding protein
VIQLEKVTKAYYGAKQITVRALQDLDLTICDGDMVAVMGASGSGTSTLMNILGCLDAPSTGRYLLDGADVSVLSRRQLAKVRGRKIGFVCQATNLIADATVAGNVELPLIYTRTRVGDDRARRALERVGLRGRQSDMPVNLSAAQRQKVVIARALINDPGTLLVDEPASDLDTDSILEIMALFTTLNNNGRTVVFTTHHEEVAAFAKRLVRLQCGKIVSDRTVTNRPSNTDRATDG